MKELKGFKIICRGRNGYFRHDCTDVVPSARDAVVKVFSKRIGSTAPIVFSGRRKVLKRYFKAIAKSL